MTRAIRVPTKAILARFGGDPKTVARLLVNLLIVTDSQARSILASWPNAKQDTIDELENTLRHRKYVDIHPATLGL